MGCEPSCAAVRPVQQKLEQLLDEDRELLLSLFFKQPEVTVRVVVGVVRTDLDAIIPGLGQTDFPVVVVIFVVVNAEELAIKFEYTVVQVNGQAGFADGNIGIGLPVDGAFGIVKAPSFVRNNVRKLGVEPFIAERAIDFGCVSVRSSLNFAAWVDVLQDANVIAQAGITKGTSKAAVKV